MTSEETRDLIGFINALYPSRHIKTDNTTIGAWMYLFEDMGIDIAKKSVVDLSKRMKYYPSIPEIVENAKNLFQVDLMASESGALKTVRVLYDDEAVPFSFESKGEANEFIKWLKGRPSHEDVLQAHRNQQAERLKKLYDDLEKKKGG